MRYRPSVRDEAGLTIVELVLAAAILLVVVAMSVTFYSYYHRSYSSSVSRSAIQQNVRLAKTMIENQIRLANYLKIGDAPADPEDFFHIYTTGGTIMRYDPATGEATELLGSLGEGITMQVTFGHTRSSFLEITVSGSVGGELSYDIGSESLVLRGEDVFDAASAASGGDLYYTVSD